MRGKIVWWRRDCDNPKNNLFGRGLIASAEFNGSTRVYFDERVAHYSPVKVGDVVEFELSARSKEKPSASRVAKIED